MSKVGLGLSIIYLSLCAYFISTQGLFGESFITLILGLPWTLALAYFEYFNASGTLAYVLALVPIVINTYILYKIGSLFSRN